MAIVNSEWWNRAAIPVQPEISISDRFKLAMELMAANLGQAIGRLVDPPYMTPDGKPLAVKFYRPDEPGPFSDDQLSQLLAIVKLTESGHQS